MTDEEKADRKALIANNKEWDAATIVRREWLANLIARKTLPKNATAVIAQSLAHATSRVSQSIQQGNSLAKTLLGLESTDRAGVGDYLDNHPTKALHVSLAIALGGVEDTTSRNSWRYPDVDVARYLNVLAEWGHPLSPVELIAAMRNEDGN
jgi:ParB family chromosome partitioning protein